MKKRPADLSAATELRRQAETRLLKQKRATGPMTDADTLRLVHELQVHQIELEMQNDELSRARAEVETLLRQYTDLYDFAPIGYFTLSPAGVILQVNLTGARLLCMERGNLVNQRFGNFVSSETQIVFSDFLNKTFAGKEQVTCEVTLKADSPAPFWMQIQAVTQADQPQTCRAIVMDITVHKQMEEIVRHLITDLGDRVRI